MIIARGAQYKVDDIGGGRVRKVLLSRQESQEVIASWFAPGEPVELPSLDYRRLAQEGVDTIERIVTLHPEVAYTFGNPQFEGGGNYTQDKELLLGDVLTRATATEGRRYIDAYVDLILRHWRYGFAERTYNYTANYGVDNGGELVLLDFGEITTDKTHVASRIAKTRWLRAWSYAKGTPEELKGYFAKVMKTRLTEDALNRHWNAEIT